MYRDIVQIVGDFHVFNMVLDGFSTRMKSDFFQYLLVSIQHQNKTTYKISWKSAGKFLS